MSGTNGQLRSLFERIERLHQEKAAISDDIKEVFAEAKGNGFDTKAMKIVLQKRRMDRDERLEIEAIVDLYMAELGMVDLEDDEPRAPAPARVRENIEEFGSESQRLKIEPVQSQGAGVDAGARAPSFAGVEGDANRQPILEAGSPVSDQSTAARMDVPLNSPADDSADSLAAEPSNAVAHLREGTGPLGAGTQAPPVDTNTREGAPADGAEPPGKVPASSVPEFSAGGENVAPQARTGEVETHASPAAHPSVAYETTPPHPVHWHAFATAFPMGEASDHQAMMNSIRAEGVKEPIIRWDNAILDGRRRYAAARELGVAYPVIEYTGTDALADVIRWNLDSRELSQADRKAIAKRFKGVPGASHRMDEIADLLGIG